MISVFVDVTVDVDVAFIILSLSQMQSTLDIIEQSWNEENERLLCAKAIQLINSKLVCVISLIRQTTNY